jgi:ABC-2 type transport system permease protein
MSAAETAATQTAGVARNRGPAGTRPGPAGTIWALARATSLAYVRDKASLFFTFAFPLVFLVLFGTIFGDEELPDGRAYIDSIASGVLAWGVANAALFGAAFTLMQWRRDDLLRLVRLTPTSAVAVVASRLVVALLVAATQVALFLGIAMLPAFGMRLADTWPAAVPVLVTGVVAFLAAGVLIGTFADTSEAVAAISNFVMVPMAFLSGSFLPLQTMPDYLEKASRLLPLRYLNDGVQAGFTGHGGIDQVWTACLALAGFALVAVLVALRTFRWSNRT